MILFYVSAVHLLLHRAQVGPYDFQNYEIVDGIAELVD